MTYNILTSKESITKTMDALKNHNFNSLVVETGAEALAKLKEMIPAGVSVMNGSSTTLNQIGFVEYLKSGDHGWKNLHKGILEETDPTQQARLRKQSVLSDYYLGSVHAVTETGELVIASASGSQLPHLAYTSPNLILVVGTQKIVPDLMEAMRRVETYVLPLEDARMKSVGMGGSNLAKILILKNEPVFMKRNITIIFVNEVLGF
jgi:L-lactate utilization protein LutC